jgi:hypothetical protein
LGNIIPSLVFFLEWWWVVVHSALAFEASKVVQWVGLGWGHIQGLQNESICVPYLISQ